jgi:asparagine synthase (glutamine-hydrolysing)
MTDILRHRGPDGQGVYIQDSVGLGHRRLAIIDLSEAGKQPMSNEDGSIWVTYNGEIYNFQEIRHTLIEKGHIFQSNTDTEVIVHAYEEWGTDCLAKFNGMFAFGLWDQQRQRLWLARDRLGIKPLFYAVCPPSAENAGCLLFGSEIKAILASGLIEARINLEGLHHYLSLNYTPAPHTLFEGVSQLLPGHYLLANTSGHIHTAEYWDVVYQEGPYRDEQYYFETFEQLAADSVRIRLVSDVPFGAFLSGGVDSSGIVYWMAQAMAQPVKTFSIGFQEKSYNELDYAGQVAQACQTDHYSQLVTANAAAVLPKIVWHAEEPTADSSMIPLYYLAQMARQHVTMALSGDGADEILAGYETYQAYYAQRLYRLLPGFIRRGILAPLIHQLPNSDKKVSLDFKLKRFVSGAELDPEAAHAYWRTIFDEPGKRLLYTEAVSAAINGADTLELYRTAFARSNARHPLNRMLYVDTRFYLPNDMLVKMDRMTMAHSLEARVPYLDYRLVEFAASIPPWLKLKEYRHKKYLLKAILSKYLPAEVLWRKKQGFNVPKGVWLKNELKEFVFDHLSASCLKEMGLFRPEIVQQILQMHAAGKRDYSHQIWGLLSLSLWWQQYIVRSQF